MLAFVCSVFLFLACTLPHTTASYSVSGFFLLVRVFDVGKCGCGVNTHIYMCVCVFVCLCVCMRVCVGVGSHPFISLCRVCAHLFRRQIDTTTLSQTALPAHARQTASLALPWTIASNAPMTPACRMAAALPRVTVLLDTLPLLN